MCELVYGLKIWKWSLLIVFSSYLLNASTLRCDFIKKEANFPLNEYFKPVQTYFASLFNQKYVIINGAESPIKLSFVKEVIRFNYLRKLPRRTGNVVRYQNFAGFRSKDHCLNNNLTILYCILSYLYKFLEIKHLSITC